MMFLSKNKTDDAILSPSKRAWRKFQRNGPAVAGLIFILLSCLVGILGYLITPDSTPFANDQKPELHIKSPGFNCLTLRVRRNAAEIKTGMFGTILYGKEKNYDLYTLNTYTFSGPNILVEEYTGEKETTGSIAGFNLADVVYALDTRFPPEVDSVKKQITFRPLEASVDIVCSFADLQKEVETKLIGKKTFLLGTDLLGRDLLSRLMIGTRISLTVGIISVLISVFIGIFLGALAGYFRGFTDTAISWFINVVWSIPTILLVIAITLVLGKGIMQVFIAVGLTMWVDVARVVRGQILGIREKEFVEAGRALGFKNGRIIFRHVLPNVMGPVIVMAASNFAAAILMEAGLSFLGIGAQPPVPSWGEMINAHRGYILMDKAYLAFIPGAAIMLLVLSFTMVGNGLRDAMDTRLSDNNPLV
jgi:peptide/nickel transport system permease protein